MDGVKIGTTQCRGFISGLTYCFHVFIYIICIWLAL